MNTRSRLAVLIAGAFVCAAVASLAARAQTGLPVLDPNERPTGALGRETCRQCHDDVLRHAAVHGPVGADACDACHEIESVERHTYVLAREGLALCTFCHDMNVDEALVVHRPLVKGECTACHNPHGGPDRKFLMTDSMTELCGECHDDVADGMANVHGPVAAGACGACHSAHASPYPNLLFAPGSELCTTCHANTKMQIDTLRVVHEPVPDDCQMCHEAHASDHAMMLRQDAQTLCLSCHETIRHTVETASTQHAAVTTERSCLNCHEPHASDYPRILQTEMMTLCFECHDREITLASGGKLGNIKRVIETGTSLHGPVAQNNCAACHQIHGGEFFRLLIQEYPPEFYAPFKEESYALCFNCHDRNVVRDARTTSLTNFRNGDVNLHFLHVNKDKKGRTCRACHETHASNRQNHIREAVPFGTGGWMLPIQFEELADGGRCAPGCHFPYEYNRVEPVIYERPQQPAIWPRPDDPGETPTVPGEIR
ncbi:MAG: cytochrome c3 family protein [Planctomycetota bacterium]|jgi:predicted CXXCH cytochrome family protein